MVRALCRGGSCTDSAEGTDGVHAGRVPRLFPGASPTPFMKIFTVLAPVPGKTAATGGSDPATVTVSTAPALISSLVPTDNHRNILYCVTCWGAEIMIVLALYSLIHCSDVRLSGTLFVLLDVFIIFVTAPTVHSARLAPTAPSTTVHRQTGLSTLWPNRKLPEGEDGRARAAHPQGAKENFTASPAAAASAAVAGDSGRRSSGGRFSRTLAPGRVFAAAAADAVCALTWTIDVVTVPAHPLKWMHRHCNTVVAQCRRTSSSLPTFRLTAVSCRQGRSEDGRRHI
ncbi:hypothetical protein BU14_0245s0008 [Porphyra umbilicalis]|uniref:Uncharacterized protein n=1 Tax=Porphyra umbilicalis TaxID=2786 RepID=A0A1X6P367_PORUM|nr:hypothetical protein BU14_0245s0008 [Porphyra umbilicalis]|eukprot:OSX75226.1 hypothetical protein BU14_0245s0008 [Porphyra umbilicalis]